MASERCANRLCYRDPKGRTYCDSCRAREWKRKNAIRYTYHNLKGHARERGIPFELTLQEWEVWCGVNNYLELRGRSADSMTVDRIYDWDGYGNKMPYRYDNIQMRSKSMNSSKKAVHMPYIKRPGDPF